MDNNSERIGGSVSANCCYYVMRGYYAAVYSKLNIYPAIFFILCVLTAFLCMVNIMLMSFCVLPLFGYCYSLYEDIKQLEFLKTEMEKIRSEYKIW
jgi:hypothetical protein